MTKRTRGRTPAASCGLTVAVKVTVVPWASAPDGVDERSTIVGWMAKSTATGTALLDVLPYPSSPRLP